MALHGEQGGEQIHAVINRMKNTAWGIRADSDRLRHLMTEHLLLVTPDLSVPVPSRNTEQCSLTFCSFFVCVCFGLCAFSSCQLWSWYTKHTLQL